MMRTMRFGNNQSSGKPSPTCRHIQRKLPLFLDGELSTRQAQEVTRHLSLCPLCQREREQWQQSEQALATARRHIPAPGDLRTGFYARLVETPVSRRAFPRIDWRVAVPALAACGLVFGWLTVKNSVAPSYRQYIYQTGNSFGWLTAKNSVAPAGNPNTTIASSPVLRPRIAQANNPVQNGVTANKPAGSAVRRFGFVGGNPARASLFDVSAAVAPNRNKRAGEGLKKRVGRRQVALLGPRHKRPESGSSLKLRRLAVVAPPAMYYGITKPADVHTGLFTEANPVRTRNRQQNSYSFGEHHTESNWNLALQRSKSTPQTDTDALAKTMNSDSAGEMSDNTFGYIASATKSKQKEELKEQSWRPSSRDASADANEFHEFALGLSDSTRRSFQDNNRGLAWSASVGENEDMYLEVEDTKRGFTSRTRFASRVQEQNGQRVLIIEAEDAAPRASSETQFPPVSEPK